MFGGVTTMVWKEWKELLAWRSANLRSRGPLSLLIVIVVFGLLMPLQIGVESVTSPVALVLWPWMAAFMASTTAAQSFAGERERHTLETLLASRLSDTAVLVGKTAAAVSYAWALALVSALLSLVTVNVAQGEERLVFWPLTTLIGMPLLALAAALAATSIGVLVSLRASTLRQAHQTVSIANMVLIFGGVYGLRALPPAWQDALARFLLGTPPTMLMALAGLLAALIGIILLLIAKARFRRGQIALD